MFLFTIIQSQQPVSSISDLFNKIGMSSISLYELVLGLTVALFIGFIIFKVYYKTFRGTVYSYTFNLSLLLITIITTLIIMTISSNLILSLGMVGALSIVRFRTAIKDPIDIVYIFWTIASGLAIGSNQYLIAIIGSIFIAIVLIISNKYKLKSNSMILIINYDYDYDDDLMGTLRSTEKNVKSKHIKNGSVELTLELKNIKDHIMKRVNSASYVYNTSLLQFDE